MGRGRCDASRPPRLRRQRGISRANPHGPDDVSRTVNRVGAAAQYAPLFIGDQHIPKRAAHAVHGRPQSSSTLNLKDSISTGRGDIATSQSACRQPRPSRHVLAFAGPAKDARFVESATSVCPPFVCPPFVVEEPRCASIASAGGVGRGRTPQRPPNALKSSSSHCFPARLGSDPCSAARACVRCRHNNRDVLAVRRVRTFPTPTDGEGTPRRSMHRHSIRRRPSAAGSVVSFRIHFISFIVAGKERREPFGLGLVESLAPLSIKGPGWLTLVGGGRLMRSI
jgi:hypothetical protein